MTYSSRINGQRVIRGVVRTLPDGRKVRLHGVRRFGELYWTADRWGEAWAKDSSQAITQAVELDIVA